MFKLKLLSKALLLAIICVGLCNFVSAQDQTRFVLKLDNDLITSFRNFRSLRSNVPDEFNGKISYIELQFAESNGGEPIELDLGLKIADGTANIKMAEETIETLKSRPVRVAVVGDTSTFSQIVLVYDAAITLETELTETPNTNESHFIQLDGDKTMAGTVEGFDQVEITTKFGKVSIPLANIAGIKFHTDSDDSAIVVLNNGDSITGVPAIPVVTLMTDWGQADIDTKSIQSFTTNSVAKFGRKETDFGMRWVLQKGGSLAPATAGIGNFR